MATRDGEGDTVAFRSQDEHADPSEPIPVAQPVNQSRRDLLRQVAGPIVGVVVVAAVIISLINASTTSVGEGGQNGGKIQRGTWHQPASPRRSIVFNPSFASCSDLRSAFGQSEDIDEEVFEQGRIDSLFASPSNYWWPQYPQDYCDFCNCTATWPFGRVYYMMEDDMAVPVAADTAESSSSPSSPSSPSAPPPAASAPQPMPAEEQAAGSSATFKSADTDASLPPTMDGADEFSGTNNQVEEVDEADIVKTDGRVRDFWY